MENKHYPKIKNVVMLFLLLIGMLILFTIIQLKLIIPNLNNNPILHEINDILTLFLLTGIIIIIGFKKTKKKFNEVFVFKNNSLYLWIIFTITMIGVIVLLSSFNKVLFYYFPIPLLLKNVYIDLLLKKNVIITIFYVGIVTAFVEEMLFRGLFLSGFKNNYSHKKAIIASALIFGIWHLYPWLFLTTFLFGLFSAYICLKTESLVLSIYMHFINNTFAVLVIRYSVEGIETYVPKSPFAPLWYNMIGVVTLVVGMYLLKAYFKKTENCINTSSDEV